ncbi:hypothetical protein D3C72_1840820 [compost metagenome]
MLLPAPEAPTIATVAPAGAVKVRSRKVSSFLPGYAKLTCSNASDRPCAATGSGSGPSATGSGSLATTCRRRVAAMVSASCRLTCEISDTGRKVASAISTSSGSMLADSAPAWTCRAPTTATARPPRPMATSNQAV